MPLVVTPDNPIPPVMTKSAAPCHEEIIEGDAIDIRNFPVPQYSPKDGGPYITPGIVVSEDPETGVPDVGHYRFLILGKDTMSYSAQPFHRFGKNLAKCKKLGIVPRAALVIGLPRRWLGLFWRGSRLTAALAR